MIKLLTIILFLFSGLNVIIFAQSDSTWHDQSHIVHGINYGVSPIYRSDNSKTYLFLESDNKLTIKNIPVDIKFRLSNEKFYYGQASYFKISYNASRYRGSLKNKYLTKINELGKLIAEQQYQLANYEAKLSFLRRKYPKDVNNITKPTLDSSQLNNNLELPNVSGKIPKLSKKAILSIDKPNLTKPNPDKLDLDSQIPNNFEKYQDSITAIQERIQGYKNTYQELQQKYQKLNQFKGADLLSKFKTIDIGLTGLNTSGSGTTIPVQGINVRYADDHYFVEAAAGFTLPNQIITTNVYQQLACNQANVFNSGMGGYFNINSTKLLARTNVGYGQLEGNNIAIETFYNSRVLKFKNEDTLYNIGLKDKITSNVNGRMALLSKKNLIFSASAGVTWLDKNTSNLKLKDHFGGSVQGEYLIRRQKIKASYRYMSANYDAWVQGIFLAQNERIELSHQMKLANKWNLRYHYARNRYFSNNIFGGTSSNEYGINPGYYGRNFGFSAGYSVLQMVDRNSHIILNKNLNHMANMMLYVNKNLKRKGRYSLNIDNNTLFLSGKDTSYKVVSSSVSNRISFDRIYVGLTLKHQYYEGLNDISGHFFIIQPELGVKIKDFYFRGFLAISKSEQYNWSVGGIGEVGFRFNKYLSWAVEAQKFLQNEYVLFRNVPDGLQPFIVKLKMIIDI